ncbi:VIT1/CCC1 transporter family protein [Leifsonia sp. Root112D2]|uniref:VIT1/CCC1 transporter family protein n=1 Tax=Leifsonia sp. Root112D2 TaxID=1736426 RepID=UPI000A9BEC5F
MAAISGGLSLGGARWSHESAEREAQLLLAAEEAEQLATTPEEEFLELAAHYEGRGVAPDLAAQVAEQLTAHDALAAQLETEHGIRQVMSRSAPAWGGVAASIAFMLGAIIPLLISLLVPGKLESWAILLVVVASLTLTSIIGARSGHTPVWRTIARTLTVGVGTLGISYLAGLILF